MHLNDAVLLEVQSNIQSDYRGCTYCNNETVDHLSTVFDVICISCVPVHFDSWSQAQSARSLACRVYESIPRADTGRHLCRQDKSDHILSCRHRQQVCADQQPRTYRPAGVHRILLR